jgi:hypothetical protein
VWTSIKAGHSKTMVLLKWKKPETDPHEIVWQRQLNGEPLAVMFNGFWWQCGQMTTCLSKLRTVKTGEWLTQVAEHLLSKHEALSSIPSTAKLPKNPELYTILSFTKNDILKWYLHPPKPLISQEELSVLSMGICT